MKITTFCLISRFSFLLMFPVLLIAQHKDAVPFENGYVVLRDQIDTLHGTIQIISNKIGRIKQVNFRSDQQSTDKKKIKKKHSYYKGDLRYFGTATRRCRYVNWVDDSIPTSPLQVRNGLSNWVTVLEEGAITVSLGFELYQTATLIKPKSRPSFLPVFCLKKGDRPLALLVARQTSETIKERPLSYKLDERNKTYFLSLIKEDAELVNKIKNDQIYLYNVLEAVKEYNKHVQEKK